MNMEQINALVNDIDSFVWGPAMLTLLVGTGIYLTTCRTRCAACWARMPAPRNAAMAMFLRSLHL